MMSCRRPAPGSLNVGYQAGDEIGRRDGAPRREIAQPTNREVSRHPPPLERIVTFEPAGTPAKPAMLPCELRKARSIGLASVRGSARVTLCTPRADKCAVRRHEPCDHRWHELD